MVLVHNYVLQNPLFDFDSLFCTKFSNVGIHFLMFVTSQSIGACIYSTPNHIWGISVTWAENQVNIPENNLYLLYHMGIKVPMAKFVLQSINCLGMVLMWLFLIEDSEIKLFENWEQFILLAHEKLLKTYMNIDK